MNDLSFQKSPDKSQIFYFLLCNYIDLFILVAIPESDRLFKHAQSLQLAGDKGHTILPGFIVASSSTVAPSRAGAAHEVRGSGTSHPHYRLYI